jgi:hypothetical protein
LQPHLQIHSLCTNHEPILIIRRYVGEWVNGKINGKGTIFLVSGDKYVGEWKDGRRHGHGVYEYRYVAWISCLNGYVSIAILQLASMSLASVLADLLLLCFSSESSVAGFSLWKMWP